MQVSRGRCLLHLTEHHGDCCPGSTVFVRISGLDEFHQEITGKGYQYMRPSIELAPWGKGVSQTPGREGAMNARVMEVIDPFGNRIRFNEDVSGKTNPHLEL